MTGRVIAVGDVHGCSTALGALIRAIDLRADDTLVMLGDFCDRGFDTRGVIDLLIGLRDRCRLVAVLGNHDELMLQARRDKTAFRRWMEFGGIVTLDAYGDTGRMNLISNSHFAFLSSCVPYFETPTHVFTHACYDPTLPFDQHDGHTLRWRSLADGIPAPHQSGRVVVVGHTPQADVLDTGHLLGVDTGCGCGGWLSAVEVATGTVWQADERGRTRTSRLGVKS